MRDIILRVTDSIRSGTPTTWEGIPQSQDVLTKAQQASLWAGLHWMESHVSKEYSDRLSPLLDLLLLHFFRFGRSSRHLIDGGHSRGNKSLGDVYELSFN